ncbi:MAG: insulinase family protein [Acidobacteriota bacterium]|nr:insulinase family protein [Acidobacteriota bacterium]
MNRVRFSTAGLCAVLGLVLGAGGASASGGATGSGEAGPATPQTKIVTRTVQPPPQTEMEVVALPSPSSPLVAIRLMFTVGSLHDPAGKEGLAALTGLMVGQAATKKRTFNELSDALYPMAAAVGTETDREVTVFSSAVHRDTLNDFTALFEEALFTPAFRESDFKRHKEAQLSILTSTLRSGSDEFLGLEALQDVLFAGHPYGHPAAGTVAGLENITLEDVRTFYRQHYTRANLIVGIAGGYPDSYLVRLQHDLQALPQGTSDRKPLPPPPPIASGGDGGNRHIVLIDKQTASVGINLGSPLPINRSDPNYYPLMVANSAFGEHRTFNGRLTNSLRIARGLNYGDYSYVEYYQSPPVSHVPAPNVPRREQYFSIWIRPVVPADAQFALRGALYELDRLYNGGLTPEEFELTRKFLINYSKLWVQDLSDRLGYHMDSRFYHMPYFIDEIEARLKSMQRDEVNRIIKYYLRPDYWAAVLVTANAADLKAKLAADEPSPKKYNTPAAAEILEADKAISAWKVKPTAIDIVPVDQMFQK